MRAVTGQGQDAAEEIANGIDGVKSVSQESVA